MKMDACLDKFISFLLIEKSCAQTTIATYKSEIERFMSFMSCNGIYLPTEVSVSFLREYIYRQKQKRELSQVSVSKIIAILKSFFNFLEEDIVIKNPTRRIKMPKKSHKLPRILSRHELEKILATIDYCSIAPKHKIRNKLIFLMLYYTGVRRSELLSLCFDDLNLSNSTITIRSGKGSKDRLIPLHPRVRKLLEQYIEQRLPLKNNAIFIGEQGKRMCKTSLIYIFKKFLAISELDKKGYTIHSFRHSFASNLIESGVDIFKVQRLLGHESLDSTKIYVSFNSSQMAKAVERL